MRLIDYPTTSDRTFILLFCFPFFFLPQSFGGKFSMPDPSVVE